MTELASFVLAGGASLVALLPLRWAALRYGLVDRPGVLPQKTHSQPVPYLGGIAILFGAALSLLLLAPRYWAVVLLLGFVAAMGLVDDIRYMPVWAKLCGETALAIVAVGLGFSWNISDSAGFNDLLSVIWIVGLTNSFNLLDNMDGLASTVAASSLIILALVVPAKAPLALPLAGAAIGFLVINRPPARMYMGDAGSLMLGFGVGLGTIVAADTARGLHSLVILFCPVSVAVFDTSLVIVSRLATGRPVQLGGTDHFSHRLKLLGWTPLQVLLGALAASGAAGAMTAFALRFPEQEAWLAVPFALGFVAAWVRLARVDPYAVGFNPRLEISDAEERI